MGAGGTTSWEKFVTLQVGFSVQIPIQLGQTQIQIPARREGLQTGTWGRLRGDILTCSQDDHTSAAIGGLWRLKT